MNELKNCPFLGGKAVVFVHNGVKVLCLTCGAKTDAPHIDCMIRPGRCTNAVQQVTDAWNRRVRNDE